MDGKKGIKGATIFVIFILNFMVLSNQVNISLDSNEIIEEKYDDVEQPETAYDYPLWRYVSRIVDSYQGPQQQAGVPNRTLGVPNGGGKGAGGMDIFSLGGPEGPQNGFIIYAFDNFSTIPVIENGPGADFVIYENGFVLSGQPDEMGFWELVEVAVSSDGTNWARFPTWCDPNAPAPGGMSGSNRSYFSGVAGTWPVNVSVSRPWADPAVQSLGGGDFMDLDDLTGHPAVLNSSVNLMNINYIKLTDIISTNPIENGDIADNGVYWKDPTWGGADLDGAFILNYHILDDDVPILIKGENKTVELGSSGNSISWNWTDANPLNYTIKLGENIIDQGSWTSGMPIELAVSASEIGINNYLCKVNDSQGNENQSYIKYEVEDTTAPNINASPSDVYYSEGDTGNSITWDWDDLDPNYYNMTRDSTPIKLEAWNSSSEDITINVDGLSANTYTFRCSVNDSSGNWAYDEVDVIVSSDLSIFGPEDFSYTVGSDGNEIQWTATTGANPDGYEIYQDDVLNETGSWTSGVPIAFDIDGLAVGEYEFNCSVKDDSGTSTFDLVNVTVEVDTQVPSLVDASSNMVLDESESGIILNWTWDDINPNEYTIKRNGMLVDGNTWISGNEISYSIGSLSINEYEFTCTVNDTHSNTNNHAIQVNVTDLQLPQLIANSSDMTIELGSIGNTINWTWSDLRPDYYKILREEHPLGSSGQWFSDVQISIAVDGLDLGEYDFKCIVNDTYGNVNNHVIKVTVVDTINPKFGNSGKSFNDVIVFGCVTEFTFWCEWFDSSDITAYLYLNTTAYIATDVVGDNYSLTISITEAGIYEYTWIAFDEKSNLNDTMPIYSFELVLDIENPSYSAPKVEDKGNSLNITIEVTDGTLSSGIQSVVLYYGNKEQTSNFILMDLNSIKIKAEQMFYNYDAILLKSNIGTILYYYFEISDNHGNSVKSSLYTYGSASNSTNTSTIPADVLGIDPLTLGFLGGITLIGGLSIVLVIRRKKAIR